jgi:hypothetical protein
MTTTNLLQTIAQALNAFATSSNLRATAIDLFATLGYRSAKTLELTPNTVQGLQDTFGIELATGRAMTAAWQSVDVLFQITDEEMRSAGSQQMLPFDSSAQVDNARIESYLFVAIRLRGEHYTRTELATITREINRHFPMPLLVLFQHGPRLTIAIINRRIHKRDAAKDVLEKVTLIKDIHAAAPHRAHLDILHDLALPALADAHPVGSFVDLQRAWAYVLSSSELNKRFYREIADWYFWATQHVTFPDDGEPDAAKRNDIGIIRLITRLIFVWFLKEKGLVPADLFNEQKLHTLLADLSPETGSYYRAILQNLFFATLNQEMGKRAFRTTRSGGRDQHRLVTNLYRYQTAFTAGGADQMLALMRNIPFLNGGLFECLDHEDEQNRVVRIDGFSDEAKNPLHVPNRLFFGAEQTVDLHRFYGTSGRPQRVRGLIHILNRYKFTVTENTPIEEEIALDPELLGQVFENLLAAYNPETGATARKQTGSFYTPREIVNYMVDEALLAYLGQHLRQAAALIPGFDAEAHASLDDRLRHLLTYTDEPPRFGPDETGWLIVGIDSMKILDPACGSGAFPIGVLQKLVFLLGKLDPGNQRWKQRQIENVAEDMRKAGSIQDAQVRENALELLEQKREDIERAFAYDALDYARKLYLIQNCIYGVDIQPIAVQIAKLRCFIALIVDQQTDDSLENRGILALPNLETKFVAANTLLGAGVSQGMLRSQAVLRLEQELATVRQRHFDAKTPATKRKRREEDKRIRQQIGVELKRDGMPGATADLLAQWDPYDQNATASFFNPMWMFSLEVGFDIVLGNPPYVLLQNAHLPSGTVEQLLNTYRVAQYKVDTYHLFIEWGLECLSSDGVMAYITPNTFLKNKFTNKLRETIIRKTVIRSIVLFYVKVFSDPSVDNLIFICSRVQNTGRPEAHQIQVHDIKSDDFLSEIKNARLYQQNNIKAPDYIFELDVTGATADIISKIEANTVKFGEIGRAYFGIQTYNRKMFVSKSKKTSYYKPVIDGANVLRYTLLPASDYVDYRPGSIKSGGDLKVYSRERIVVRQIGKYPEGCLCPRDILTLNTIYNLYLTTDAINIRFVLGILNSGLIRFYWLSRFYDNKATFPKIKKKPLESLPFKQANREQQQPIITLVDRILATKRANPHADVSALEAEIDAHVYQLYGLTPEEIAVVEGSSAGES